MTTFIIELEKGLDWENGYLNHDNMPVTDIKEACEFEEKEDAEDAASLFNMEYGQGGRVYARVR